MRYLTARLGLFLIICSFSINTYAQNVAPAIEDTQILEQLIIQKEQTFKELFNDPTNMDLLFRYANICILVGDLEGAIGVFEQMLIYNRELPRIRLELGVLYFRLGAYALAKNYLESVKQFNPPETVLERVEEFLSAINNAEKRITWKQNIAFGLKHTSNGNSGINADFIEISNFILAVDPESKRDGDRAQIYNYNLSINQKLDHPRGDNIEYQFNINANQLTQYENFNTLSNQLLVKRNYNLGSNYLYLFDLEEVKFVPSFSYQRVILGREEILNSTKLSFDYSGLTQQGLKIISLYIDKKVFPTSGIKDGQLRGLSYLQSFGVGCCAGNLSFKATIENYRANAMYEFFENYALDLVFSQPLENNYFATFNYTYSQKRYDAPLPLFGDRDDRSEALRINLMKTINACWTWNLGLASNDARSTINIYKRRENSVSLQFAYGCFG